MAATHSPRTAEPARDQAQAPHPPANIEAEEHVLGAMMLSPAAIAAVRPAVQARDFWRESHARMYRAILDLADAAVGVDAITVADELEKRGELPDDGGRDRIRDIASLAPAATNARHWADLVAELARLREIITFGENVSRLAWDRTDSDAALAKARELLAALDERRAGHELQVESWHEFESKAHDEIPVLVDRLWPEQAFGFIAAPPKKGKTWVALALAVAVASGKPLFGEYAVPTPRPVLYVALEGHRAALRARVGAIARGMNIDPDGQDLQRLHFLYKPPGMNLADPVWAQRLRRAAAHVDAALAVIDVLRAGARIKENDQADFTALRHNLQPINDDGRSLALLHHFVKLSEISKERDPGERMSGSGAMFGALDAAIYITGSQNHARELRLAFDLRDLATPDDISITLEGDGSGPGGGYTYRDAARWAVTAEETSEDDFKSASPHEIADFVRANDGDVKSTEIRAHFGISADTLTRRLGRLAELGIDYLGGRGQTARLVARTPQNDPDEESAQLQMPHADTRTRAEPEPLNGAASHEEAAQSRTDPVRNPESSDLQGKENPHDPAPFGSAPARARARRNPEEPDGRSANGESDLRHPSGDRGTDRGEGLGARHTSADRSQQDSHQGREPALHPDAAQGTLANVRRDTGPTSEEALIPKRLTEQAAWITNGGWMADDLDTALYEHFPMTSKGDLPRLRQLAADIANRELGATS